MRRLVAPRSILAGLVFATLFSLCSRPAAAAPIVLQVHAETCFTCPFLPPSPPHFSLDGYFTVVPGTGIFWDPVFADWSAAGVWEVIAADVVVSDGVGGLHQMSLAPQSTQPDLSRCPPIAASLGGCNPGWWLEPGYRPAFVGLETAAGGPLRLIDDHGFLLAQDRGAGVIGGSQIPISFTAVPVPDSGSTLLLFGIALGGLAAVRARMPRVPRRDRAPVHRRDPRHHG